MFYDFELYLDWLPLGLEAAYGNRVATMQFKFRLEWGRGRYVMTPLQLRSGLYYRGIGMVAHSKKL